MRKCAMRAGGLVAGVLVAGGALSLSGSARAGEPLVLDPAGLDRVTAAGTAFATIVGLWGPDGEIGYMASLGGPGELEAKLDAFTQAKADAKGAQASARLFFLQNGRIPPGSSAIGVGAGARVLGSAYASTEATPLPPI